jgi:UDP-glucose 4-epimerase
MILVTGGAGFIGSHLVKTLAELGNSVRVLDNLSTGKKQNLAGLSSELQLIIGDIRDPKAVCKAVENVDIVVHLAALIDVHESLEKPLLYHDVNSTGTLNLLESSRGKLAKFILASTAAVYGNPVRLPIGENHSLNPVSPYAASKLSAENYCLAFHNSYGLRTTVLRLFNVYGPGQSPRGYSGVITKFIDRIRKNQPLEIFGDGKQTRDFIFVDDVVRFILKALECDAAGIYNVGTGRSVSIRCLADLLLELTDRKDLGIVFDNCRPEDVLHSVADMSKSSDILGLKSGVGLREGLSTIIHEAS